MLLFGGDTGEDVSAELWSLTATLDGEQLVWTLLQPRDYINSLQLISALALIVAGLFAAALFGFTPSGADSSQALEFVAPAFQWHPEGAPMIFPFLFITIACGAVSGFHCLVSSGTSSKQLKCETDARFVGYGSMLTEGFLATLVILACGAGLGLVDGLRHHVVAEEEGARALGDGPQGVVATGGALRDTARAVLERATRGPRLRPLGELVDVVHADLRDVEIMRNLLKPK